MRFWRAQFPGTNSLGSLSNKAFRDFAQTLKLVFQVTVHDVVVADSIKKQSTMSWPLTVSNYT